jgi:hypothetical protein
MATYIVSLAVNLDRHVSDEQAVQVGRGWAEGAGLVLGMTSTSRDEPWLRVQGMRTDADVSAAELAQTAALALEEQARALGRTVVSWHAVEVLDEGEVRKRSERPVIPPVYTTEQFAEAAGLKRQRIHQYLSDLRAGKRDDFPDQALPGLWLRSEADHWIRTRRTKPGPAPKAAS